MLLCYPTSKAAARASNCDICKASASVNVWKEEFEFNKRVRARRCQRGKDVISAIPLAPKQAASEVDLETKRNVPQTLTTAIRETGDVSDTMPTPEAGQTPVDPRSGTTADIF